MNSKGIVLLACGMLLLVAVDIILPATLFLAWGLDTAFASDRSPEEIKTAIGRIAFLVTVFPALYAVEYLLIKSSLQPQGKLAQLMWRLRTKN